MKKFIIWFFSLAVVAVAAVGGYAIWTTQGAIQKMHQSSSIKTADKADTVTKAGKPIAILLLGTDTGALDRSYKGRTDSMMIAVVNPKKKQTLLLSLQRDTPIIINGQTVKLNAAYAYGSADSSIAQVEKLVNIKLNGYALINMGGLESIVNSLNGVNVTSNLTFTEFGHSFVDGTTYDMRGDQLLAYVRERHQDPRGDYGRQLRQQQVIKAVLAKAATNPTTIFNQKFINRLSSNILTDLSFSSFKNLASNYRKALDNIKSGQMVGTSATINGQSMQLMSQTEKDRVHTELEDALK
ncbi:LCP family protein [Oenococcus sicerae]|uniref:LytR family transcriptional regulator n=1 Tax=Oenococcus sicerae TaxID=2203724 RepID=A0AAJ1VN61_9LACO|nr:LCP family protein [Oenococcus sicerae]MDN6900411.1 LytR family transcriptional regulator [Oenococcus sicerae]